MKLRLSIAFIVGFAVSGMTPAVHGKVIDKAEKGKPPLKTINVLAFADDGVLLIGDGAGSQIVAVKTGEKATKKRFTGKIDGIGAKIAARLGSTTKNIAIVDLAVNPVSGTAYIAVRQQAARKYVIVTVDSSGEIGEFELDGVEYARIKLSAGNVKISRITDVAWADGRIVAAGRGSGTFTSKIFSIDTPISHDSTGRIISAETYHVSHRRWETRAPMSVLVPFKEAGKSYVVGAFSCTPVVKFPIDDITNGGKVKGVSMIELGSGNRPIDMIVYEKDKKSYVLSNTYRFKKNLFGPSKYWTVRFEQSLLAGDEVVNAKAIRRLKGTAPATPRIKQVTDYNGVKEMDKLDAAHALVLRETKTGLSLEALPLP